MYFYIQSNRDWNYDNKAKYGITSDLIRRSKTDQHSHRSIYIHLYKYQINEDDYKLKYKEIDDIITKQKKSEKFKLKILKKYPNEHFEYLFDLKEYLIQHDGGTEFISKDGLYLLEKIILIDFPKLGIKTSKITLEEIERINKEINKKVSNYSSDSETSDEENYEEIYSNKVLINTSKKLRDYQELLITEGINKLKNNNKLYISLATGGGKSVIAYSIINMMCNIEPHTIIILTPRINICEQNIKSDYIKILKNNYKIYNKDNIKSIKNNNYNIICCCINSYKKVYETIINNQLSNIIIWFDEAHYGIDNWIMNINLNEMKCFLLTNNDIIKYRLFTSASPDKDFISIHDNIYGELYNPIKTKDLMNNKWLAELETTIYKEDYNGVDNESFIDFILNNFNNKKAGLCFCNCCDNALELFRYHLELFESGRTIIKPYLLLNDNKIKEYLIKDKIKYKNADLFEIDGFENEGKRIGYIVRMYSMGYDNKDIDLLIFKDPKLSHKDIIQSIGRGTRPDGLDIDGKNLNKKTTCIIPVYIDKLKDDAFNFDKIKEVLKYLLLDVELHMNKIKIINKRSLELKFLADEDKEEYKELLKFEEEIQTIIYNIYSANIIWDVNNITRQLKYNDIHNISDYIDYIAKNPQLNLPKDLFKEFSMFDFNYTYKHNLSPYYNKTECIETIKKLKYHFIINKKINKNNNKEIIRFLSTKDNKIPNECLWTYYGGTAKDYILFN